MTSAQAVRLARFHLLSDGEVLAAQVAHDLRVELAEMMEIEINHTSNVERCVAMVVNDLVVVARRMEA